ncbi:hypothetical protein ACFO26_02395 [Lactococcus nasutitermitis]|uniref:Uncharacterized protein n=1 Tax=Lactococcus nasutitermitis TaxID=1652957 RepID=A0ABV9JB67_9LACT|nr:hypothetical protein [Lactococcus nasutitermitis]
MNEIQELLNSPDKSADSELILNTAKEKLENREWNVQQAGLYIKKNFARMTFTKGGKLSDDEQKYLRKLRRRYSGGKFGY